MYIQPTGNVILLSGCPCDADYTNTLWWEKTDTGKQAQYNYFYGLRKSGMIFNDFSTIRVNGSTIRVPINSERLYDVNYLMFQNAHFNGKWFYAFVTSVNYINNEVTEITFTVDVIQTWYFDYDFNECFVERQHVANDSIGTNIVPENFAIGELIVNAYHKLDTNLDKMAIILAVMETDDSRVKGNMYDGVYGASRLYKCNIGQSTEVLRQTAINNLNAKIYTYRDDYYRNIIGLYLVPKTLLYDNNDDTTGVEFIPYGERAPFLSYFETPTSRKTSDGRYIPNTGTALDGYFPNNYKLYTFPYNYLHIDNGSGDSIALRYEFFKDQIPTLEIDSTITSPVQLALRPKGYKGTDSYEPPYENGETLNTETLTLTGYPQCSVATDYFSSWIAQNSLGLALAPLKTALSYGASMGVINAVGSAQMNTASDPYVNRIRNTNPPAGDIPKMIAERHKVGYSMESAVSKETIETVNSASTDVLNNINSAYQASIHSNICVGGLNNSNVNISAIKQNFFVGRVSIDKYSAKKIDDYFTMFGYSIAEIKVPNTHARSKWTYIKTIHSTIKGTMPTDDEKLICAIHDKGLTYWVNGSEVGNYSLARQNTPLLNE